ncbi:MAG TPA: SufE family protein, partial [Pirellulales bacterium]
MTDPTSPLASRLAEIIDEFRDAEPRERLELLLEMANSLPPLAPELAAQRDAGLHRVHECQTPVFLWVGVSEGRVAIQADVAPESPTVKGFVALLAEAFGGAMPEQVLATPADLIQQLGLTAALGMTRMRGLHAILYRVREEVRKAAGKGSAE